ncbi:MAG TPA: ArsA-related P-loop ATPase [Candidatus Binataceae bacterium]|nr:ArsA-related P-loop ATPase [Candidatus Binataceae bacterium]HVB80016.1 ArsA-related P-loop ATPase [Candidatus Binataceae bacterium]
MAESGEVEKSERPGVKEFLKPGHTIILLGTGGVGKTTIAAAIGLASAGLSRKTALITIDPARRLREALGLRRLDDRPTRIDRRRLERAGLDPGLGLYAMVLDVKRQWDALVERFIADPAARKHILANRFYRSLAGQMAGSDAYAALEQLYDVHDSGRFEVAIVDTPPAAHAFEFIQAPGRIARLLESGPARLFAAAPSLPGSRLALGLASRAARFVIAELERFTGTEVLSSITDFFSSAAVATSALADRFRKAEAMLRSPTVHFIIVTTAEPDRLSHARELIDELEREGLCAAAIIVNRFLDEEAWDAPARDYRRPTAPMAELSAAADRDPELHAALDYLQSYQRGIEAAAIRVEQFARELPDHIGLAAAPEIAIGVADLAALKSVATRLLGAAMPVAGARGLATRPARGRPARARRKSKPE